MSSSPRWPRAGATLAALAGVLVGAPAAHAACLPEPLAQPFAPWGDAAHYSEVPGGGFEAGMPDWTRSTGAQVVNGNEPFYARSASDTRSLRLAARQKAVSPAFCVSADHPTLRFFAQQADGLGGKLKVEILYPHGSSTMVKKAGLFDNYGNFSSWSPTAVLPLADELPSSFIAGGGGQVRLQVSPDRGTWLIDDLFYDPVRRG